METNDLNTMFVGKNTVEDQYCKYAIVIGKANNKQQKQNVMFYY